MRNKVAKKLKELISKTLPKEIMEMGEGPQKEHAKRRVYKIAKKLYKQKNYKGVTKK